jgi:hypothetical protein
MIDKAEKPIDSEHSTFTSMTVHIEIHIYILLL